MLAPLPTLNPLVDWLTTTDIPITWLIPDLVPQDYLITLIAGEGAGKSTLAYALSMALAAGEPVLGRRPPVPRPVLYFDCENSLPDAMAYARRTWIGFGRPSLDLLGQHLWIDHFSLGGPDWPKRVTERVLAVHPALIVCDTAISCFPPLTTKGEDDNADAIRTINKLREISRLVVPHASVLILKHAKVFPVGVQEYDLRGAKAWKGAADSVLFLVKNPGRASSGGHTTRLFPLKPRAYGLQEELHITPTWLEERHGLRLDVREQENCAG